MSMTSASIRNKFLEFFRSKHHHIVPSAPIVIKNDPSLMFTNAGMNQFKDYFLGNRTAPYPRIVDTQKCLRVSGKHNDLEEVGVDTYHHTMFEMLGNWSFGDYFKKEAIAWSWELLTKVMQIPEDRLYVTVFEGDESEGLPKDQEAAVEWQKWIDPDRILLGNKKDNFWEMGDTGPCGPCTEIHVDSRPEEERKKIDAKVLVNVGHPQVIEIWNNVFIQYNRLKNGALEQLPARHVDTGMGFERLVRTIQGKNSNYETDIFTQTIEKIKNITKKEYYNDDSKASIAVRVNADHIRAIAFTIADGQLPSNTGAGYVIRRILRRAVRYYYSYLDHQQPLLYQLVPILALQYSEVFPELKKQEEFVARVIREEEEGFLRTLEKGLKRMEESIALSPNRISGKDAFELYDTYGFPLDLTRLIAAEKNITVEEQAFNLEMQKQKDRSRAATVSDASDWIVINEGRPEFVGYKNLETTTPPLKWRKVTAKGKDLYQLVLEKTPFYAESGGQVGDKGTIMSDQLELQVVDTKKENDLILHIVEKMPDQMAGFLTAKVDAETRRATAIHHTATHLLHAALRMVLGTHVAQKGSLVNASYLRFDFSHYSKLSQHEIQEVEGIVNRQIRKNIPVVVSEMPRDQALKLGAMALFGEKYGEVVRVVTIDPSYSVELCGGTHVTDTGELGFFKIVTETAVAAGVRRIEALSGASAEVYLNEQLEKLNQLNEKLRQPKDLVKTVDLLLEEVSSLKKQAANMEQEQLKTMSKALLHKVQTINGAHFIGEIVTVSSADALKKLAFELKQTVDNAFILLLAAIANKASAVVLIDDQLAKAKNLDAGSLVKNTISPLIKGGGGGQKTLATAGGQDILSLHQVIASVRALL